MQCKLFEVKLDTGVKDFKPACTNDKDLMAFLQVGYQKTQLQSLNKCWMFLQLIYVSDICNGIGTEVEHRFWEGNRSILPAQYKWPQTASPTPSEWQV